MAESPVICRQCGTANPPGNNFCGQCGTYMASRPAIPAGVRPRPVAPSAEEARNRRNIAIIYTITAIFVLSCIVLSIVVIIWRP
jgi:predicted nucleic acid-binding Zn ribbon protein